MPTWAIIVVVAVIAALCVGAWFMLRERRTRRLRAHFGPEYDRLLRESRDRNRAERELERREERVRHLEIRSLPQHDRDRFVEAWRADQARFVDDPKGAVLEADKLVNEVMHARGYPVGDFEQRAADISVDHPDVVANYRVARDLVARFQQGEAGTEDLRRAMVCYRALFGELLELEEARR